MAPVIRYLFKLFIESPRIRYLHSVIIRRRAAVAGRVTAGQTDQADQTDPVGAPEMKAVVGPQRGCRLQSSVASHADHQTLASVHTDSPSLMIRGRGRQRTPSVAFSHSSMVRWWGLVTTLQVFPLLYSDSYFLL